MPSIQSILVLSTIASLTSALTVTSPPRNTVWDSSKDNTISWTSVNTDPTSFDIYLSHMSGQPSINTLLFADVQSDKKSVVLSGVQLPTGTAYQINLVAHDKPEQIYAQSQQFNITGEGVAATSTVDGYTGPTHNADSTKSGSDESKTTLTRSTTAAAGAATTQATTTESADSQETETSTSTQPTQAIGNVTRPIPTPSSSVNAAVGNVAVSGSFAALLFGAAAMLV